MAKARPRRWSARRSPGGASRSAWSARSIRTTLRARAYAPLESASAEQRALLANPALAEVARRHDATPAQVALAWLLRQDGVVVIPKAVRIEHVQANRAALELALDADDLASLDTVFPPPARKRPLAMR